MFGCYPDVDFFPFWLFTAFKFSLHLFSPEISFALWYSVENWTEDGLRHPDSRVWGWVNDLKWSLFPPSVYSQTTHPLKELPSSTNPLTAHVSFKPNQAKCFLVVLENIFLKWLRQCCHACKRTSLNKGSVFQPNRCEAQKWSEEEVSSTSSYRTNLLSFSPTLEFEFKLLWNNS